MPDLTKNIIDDRNVTSDKIGMFDSGEAARLEAEHNPNGDITKANVPLVETARDQSIQERGKDQEEYLSSAISNIFQSADTLPRYWSTARDLALDDLWHASDLLSGAMYAMVSKMTTIPFHVEARDMSVTSHLLDAERFERKLLEASEWGAGWGQFFSKQVESLLGQDNGRFMEIIDLSPDKSSAIRGPALAVAHLDPSRCQRTSNPTFPVLYRRTDGKLTKLHWTRVAFEAHLPSPKIDLYGIGLCAVSRGASYAQHMLDIAKYKEEKLGSRPMRGILLVGGGLNAEMVGQAMNIAAGVTDSRGLTRFAWLPLVGATDIETPSLELIQLSQLPDGFDEQDATDIAMAAIALAFGVDARELWPGMQAASTRADALLSHIKQRGKGPGHILQETERLFNNWFLPRYLKLVFDFQDDAQDRQKAEIRHQRASTRKIDIENLVTDSRIERERMVKEGELSTAQFKTIELTDGRLPDGTPIEVLFFRDEPIYQELLTLSGVSAPLNFRANEPEPTLDQIAINLSSAYELLSSESRQIQKQQILQSVAALEFIRIGYEQLALADELEEQQALEAAQGRTISSALTKPTVSPESPAPLDKRPDDEQNMANLENSPREITGKDTNMLQRLLKRKASKSNKSSGLRKVLLGLEELMQKEEELPPIINFTPTVEVNIPPQPPTEVNVTVEPAEMPEIIVPQAPIQIQPTPIEIKVEAPIVEVEVKPEINLPAPSVTKEDSKYEVVEILERDKSGEIKKIKRERVDG